MFPSHTNSLLGRMAATVHSASMYASGTADEIAADWARNLGASTDKIKRGIANVKVAPGQAAAAAKDVWAQRTQDSKDKFARNVSRVTLQEWQQAATDKGINRIASGATAAQSKMAGFLTQLLPFQERLVATLPSRGTLEQNIARSAAFIRGMSNFKRQ